MFKNLVQLITVLIAALSIQLHASEFDYLFDHPTYTSAKISPDGKHLAVGVMSNGEQAMMVIETKSYKTVGSALLAGKDEVGDFYWVNDERLVIAIVRQQPWLKEARYTGELFAINYNGEKGEMIFGYRNHQNQTGSRIKTKKAEFAWASIIDLLPEDKEHIVIKSTPMKAGGDAIASVYKLNVYSGKHRKHGSKAPTRYANIITDTDGKAVLASGMTANNKVEAFVKGPEKWQALDKDKFGSQFSPIGTSADQKHAYIIDNFQQDKNGLFKLNLETLEYSHIFTDKKVDIVDFEQTKDTNEIYALRIDEGFPTYILLNQELEEAKIFKALTQSFVGQKVNITSRTDDGSQFIVQISSDIEPGAFYIYNKDKNTLDYLFNHYPKVDKKQLAITDPFHFTTSDGAEIFGYFTQATNVPENEIAPLVVLVHGGPHARDYWSYSSENQFLALNGYSVMQVNFRGSTGYGEAFKAAGYLNWGTVIQQDIHEAMQWAIAQGKASKDKVCIMGASFGGYSALQNPINYPESYQCAIANAGVYDLEMLYNKGDIQYLTFGDAYLEMTIGTDEVRMKNQSPVHQVNKFNVPLFLAHGEQDERAPIAHANALIKQLKKHNKSFEWFEVDDAAHGFYDPVTQKKYMNSVVNFLDKHLK